jgi:hypothetical protein
MKRKELKITFTRAGKVLIDGAERGSVTPDGRYWRVTMDTVLFPYNRMMTGRTLDRTKVFETQALARTLIAKLTRESTCRHIYDEFGLCFECNKVERY